jgi:hypothetical protein
MWNENQNDTRGNRVKATQELLNKNKMDWPVARAMEESLWRAFMNRDAQSHAVSA